MRGVPTRDVACSCPCDRYDRLCARWRRVERCSHAGGARVAGADTFLIEDVEECVGAIERAVQAVEVRGMESLIMRLPKGATKMPERQ